MCREIDTAGSITRRHGLIFGMNPANSCRIFHFSDMYAINTNIRAQFAHAALAMIDRKQSVAMEQLSTGKRINSARDDAAGMAIAARMSALIRGTNQAIKNANDGINLVQTAEGAAQQMVDMLQRMRELAVQAANGSNTAEQRGYMDLEFQQLKQEMVGISKKTQWNGSKLLDGTAGTQAAPAPLFKTASVPKFAASYSGVTAIPERLMVDTAVSPSASVTGWSGGFNWGGQLSLSVKGGVVTSAKFKTDEGTSHDLKGVVSIDAAHQVTVSRDLLVKAGLADLADADVSFNVGAGDQNLTLKQPTVTTSQVFNKPGTWSLTLNADASAVASAHYTLLDGTALAANTNAFLIEGDTITLRRDLTTGLLKDTLTEDLVMTQSDGVAFLGGDAVEMVVEKANSLGILKAGDLILNGVSIVPTDDLFDTSSPRSNARASAISKVGLINLYSDKTGVKAVVNENQMAGLAMKVPLDEHKGSFEINGYRTVAITASTTDAATTRRLAVEAINAIQYLTGVQAIDTKSDSNGVVLKARDGRNIEVSFVSETPSDEFGAVVGVRYGVQASTYSLAAHDQQGLKISADIGSDIAHSGLQKGQFSQQQLTSVVVNAEQWVSDKDKITNLQSGDLMINGVEIPASNALDDPVSNLTVETSSRYASAVSIAAAINSQTSQTRVTALVNPVTLDGNHITTEYEGTAVLYINGQRIEIAMTGADDATTRKEHVMRAINHVANTGVTAIDNGSEGISLQAVDGRNVSVWFQEDTDLTVSEFGLGVLAAGESVAVAPPQISSGDGVTSDYTHGATVYASIVLQSTQDIDIRPGYNGYDDDSHFSALGFQENRYGVTSSVSGGYFDPPKLGRLSFQVGGQSGQSIDVYLPDFSNAGTLTQAVTWDVGLTETQRSQILEYQRNPVKTSATPKPEAVINDFFDRSATGSTYAVGVKKDPPASTLADIDSALVALQSIDQVLNNLSQAQSTLGAVVNRLEQSVSNLSTYYVNMSASRSQIEDADYASTSSEMAKAQIMQQAATAILAQANTNQQTVLKLLQG